MAKKNNDSRFSSAGYDPRFIVPSTKKNKVKVDERFSKKELHKLNVTATGKKAKVDRYGRRLSDAENKDYDRYFEEKSGDESDSESASASASEGDSESDSGSDSEEAVKTKVPPAAEVPAPGELESAHEAGFVDRARGEGLVSDSDSEVEMDSDIESEIEEEKPEVGEPSAVFAAVNLDWDNVRAVDLLSTFSSFVPKNGSIKSVSIYASEFGKEQMQKEETEGPPKELFKKRDDSDSSDEELDLSNKDDLEKAARKLYTEDDGQEDYDSKALRKYQLQRLRYYYAIVVCDSVHTAQNIYTNCDGTEYESTANIFDLRYVPDDMEFEDPPKDQCTKIPASYRPDAAFVTDALQHLKVKLTWDETPKERTTLSLRHFSQKEIDEMDFQAYLASDSEDEALREKYQSLFGKKKTEDEDEGEVDMEITFNPGLAEKEEKVEKEESTIDAYKRKEKERRQRRAERYEKEREGEKEKESAKSAKSAKDKRKKAPEDPRAQAELELLLMDEDEKQHFNMKDIVKAEKKKGKHKTEEDTFQPDLADERFAEVFENHEFAIDPTNSEFKKTNTMKKILKERGERLGKKRERKEKRLKDDSLLTDLVQKFKKKKT